MAESDIDSYLGSGSSSSQFEDPQPVNTDGATSTCFMVKVHGRRMFLKHIRQEYAADPRYQDAFRKEFEVGYNLDHPNIVRYYEMGADNLGSYILQEFVDGCSLKEFLVANPDYFCKEQNMRTFIQQLFGALGHIHAHQTLHLDVKPDNLLITRIGHDVKLVDFGFCYTDEFQDTPGSTASFASPEVLAKTHCYDQRSDIYSAGAVLLYIYKVIGKGKPPKQYDSFIRRCMADRPEDRFQNAEEALLSLDRNPIIIRPRLLVFAVAVLLAFLGIVVSKQTVPDKEQDTDSIEVTALPSASDFIYRSSVRPQDTPTQVVDMAMDSIFSLVYLNVQYLWADGGVRNTLKQMTDKERTQAIADIGLLLSSLPEAQQHQLSALLMMFPYHRVYIYQNYRKHLLQPQADSLALWMKLAGE